MFAHIHTKIFEYGAVMPKHLDETKCYTDVNNIIPQTQQKAIV